MVIKLIKFLQELKRPETITADGLEYMNSDYSPVRKPTATCLSLNTLTGLVDYITAGIDAHDQKKMLLHVLAFNQVYLTTEIFGDWRQRENLLKSTADAPGSTSDRWTGTEEFIINLNSLFEHTEDFKYLVEIVSGLSSESVIGLKDDGASQTTTVKSGIALRSEEKIKNPLILQPFRTFPEIEQPKIEFVFRLQKGRCGEPECALFEADGGKWRLETIHKIKSWLKTHLEETPVNIIA